LPSTPSVLPPPRVPPKKISLTGQSTSAFCGPSWGRHAHRTASLRFNEHIEGDGPTVFAHACKMGLEGIVSKRKDSAYRSGRSPDWLKMKSPEASAVKREAEEDWSKERWR
jgi:hypothetical protein